MTLQCMFCKQKKVALNRVKKHSLSVRLQSVCAAIVGHSFEWLAVERVHEIYCGS